MVNINTVNIDQMLTIFDNASASAYQEILNIHINVLSHLNACWEMVIHNIFHHFLIS